ncbi:MAG: hypothetical protein IH604_19515 [Burkholderiales bacterium]|nr:hypothetical protein [Burkholderiales bacterium]
MRLLTEAGIPYREARSPFRLFGADAIWVSDDDYPRACAILEGEAKAFAEIARAEWKAEWIREHKASYLQWLWSRVRQASLDRLVTILFLIALVGVMLFYPLAFVFR